MKEKLGERLCKTEKGGNNNTQESFAVSFASHIGQILNNCAQIQIKM